MCAYCRQGRGGQTRTWRLLGDYNPKILENNFETVYEIVDFLYNKGEKEYRLSNEE